jgi:siroheme synthase
VLEGAAVRLEAGHPGLAGAIRSVIDALAKAGI